MLHKHPSGYLELKSSAASFNLCIGELGAPSSLMHILSGASAFGDEPMPGPLPLPMPGPLPTSARAIDDGGAGADGLRTAAGGFAAFFQSGCVSTFGDEFVDSMGAE